MTSTDNGESGAFCMFVCFMSAHANEPLGSNKQV